MLRKLLAYIKRKVLETNTINVTPASTLGNAIISNSTIVGTVVLKEGAMVVHGVTLNGQSKITVGAHSIINGPNTDIICMLNEVIIGKFVSIARNVSIQEYNHNYKGISTHFVPKRLFNEKQQDIGIYSTGPVIIENDVWIGTQCVVLSGVTIHNGAIIAANSVVTKDIPAYAIAAGTPAKVIGYRFEEPVRDKLLKLQWWDWDKATFELHKEVFYAKEITLDDLEAISQKTTP